MEDNAKHASSYQLDQEILDYKLAAQLIVSGAVAYRRLQHQGYHSRAADQRHLVKPRRPYSPPEDNTTITRGIDMTVEEVAGLSTCKYSERVKTLKLSEDDLAFLKGLRRRIKNRLASQNSRRRSVEHLRRLTRELRAVRACRDDALSERRALALQRDTLREHCTRLRRHLVQILEQRSDTSEVPTIETKRIKTESQTPSKENPIKKVIVAVTETKTPLISECFREQRIPDKHIFECRIDKLVQQSVNHIFKSEKDDKRKVFAKTVFISNEKLTSDIKSMVLTEDVELKGAMEEEGEVLNLSVKEGRKRGHGRKQSAPRRIAYAFTDSDDGVLDLKIKKMDQ